MPSRLALLASATALAAACSTSPPAYTTERCADAAAQHAHIEMRWLIAAATHTAAHVAGGDIPADEHAQIEGEALTARVDTLIAEAATRHHCG